MTRTLKTELPPCVCNHHERWWMPPRDWRSLCLSALIVAAYAFFLGVLTGEALWRS